MIGVGSWVEILYPLGPEPVEGFRGKIIAACSCVTSGSIRWPGWEIRVLSRHGFETVKKVPMRVCGELRV